MKENQDLTYQYVLEEEGHVYVCGDNNMAIDVLKALVHILGSKGKMTSEEAHEYVTNMQVCFLKRIRETYLFSFGR